MDYVVKGRIQGRVQGVGYRQFIKQLATEKNLTGWARNLTDGTVEVLLQGKREDVNEIQHQASIGPAAGEVRSLSWDILDEVINCEQFSIG